MAFLFIWQFLISGPLEIASGVIALEQFSTSLHPKWNEFNNQTTMTAEVGTWNDGEEIKSLTVSFGPTRIFGVLVLVGLLLLLYRRISTLGRWTVTFWLGVVGAIAWILFAGAGHFQSAVAFDFSGDAAGWPDHFWLRLGKVMILAMYSYLGYYNICYIGDEVRNPGKTIPRSIILSALLVCFMFVALHLVMLGVVSWHEVAKVKPDDINLPAVVMERIYQGQWAATLMSLLLMWSCFGSAFAGLLGYSRIPYGAARQGHFFSALGKVHPVLRIPHVSLLLVGGITLFWSFFDLANVINALLTTRILEQFIGQIFGVMLLRRQQPNRPRPYRIWLYPLPCGLALVGWLYMYVCSGWPFVLLGLVTLGVGLVVFLLWSWNSRSWPFAVVESRPK
jgi:amino acid transporter